MQHWVCGFTTDVILIRLCNPYLNQKQLFLGKILCRGLYWTLLSLMSLVVKEILSKTEGSIIKDNPDTVTLLGTQDTYRWQIKHRHIELQSWALYSPTSDLHIIKLLIGSIYMYIYIYTCNIRIYHGVIEGLRLQTYYFQRLILQVNSTMYSPIFVWYYHYDIMLLWWIKYLISHLHVKYA